jgi:TolB protein
MKQPRIRGRSLLSVLMAIGAHAFVVASLSVLATSPRLALLKIDITQGNVDPLPIGIPDFIGTNEKEVLIGGEVAKVITNNLTRSGLFRPLDPRSFIEKRVEANATPRFGDWEIINALGLVIGQTSIEPDGRLKVEFRLWDVLAKQQIVGLQFFTTPENWRRVAHLVSDAIYQRLTGERGYFDTRLVYIAESGPKGRGRVKRLAIMDQDGANPSFLTDGGDLVLTPRFSPTSQEITYLSYYGDVPRVYLFNIETGQQEVVGDFPGMTFAPRFAPDGNKIIMSLERSGNSDIYTMDLRTRQVERLTRDPSIDTSPSFSPDHRQVTFNSDRGGTSQLYVMNSDGSGVHRISHDAGRYSTPVWSPRGDLVAFTKQYQGNFFIGVMRPDGSGERILTRGYHAEGPSWSPNGRVIIFFRETPSLDGTGRGYTTSLWSVDLTGYNLRPVITTLGDASDPAWSPLIE